MNDFEGAVALASSIRGARLVALDSRNHIVLVDEPAWQVFVAEVRQFLAPDRTIADAVTRAGVDGIPHGVGIDGLSARELEVLRLAAQGQDNEEIAEALGLSIRTVERHLQNVYLKLDLRGKSARTAAVVRLLTHA
jgi:DNA-binding NarL/FixJ family response regulator